MEKLDEDEEGGNVEKGLANARKEKWSIGDAGMSKQNQIGRKIYEFPPSQALLC